MSLHAFKAPTARLVCWAVVCGLTSGFGELTRVRADGSAALAPFTRMFGSSATESASETAAPPERDLAQLRKSLADDMRQVEAEGQAPSESDASSHQALLLGHLKYLDSVYAQQQMVAEREKEVTTEREQIGEQTARFEILGNEALANHTFADLESERDALDDVAFQLELTDNEIRSTRSLLDSVKEQYTTNERQRRLLQEKIEKASDPTSRSAMQRELRIIELRGQIAEELVVLHQQELRVKQLERKTLEEKEQGLKVRVQTASRQVPLLQSDLDVFLRRLDDEQARTNQFILQQQQTLQKLEQQMGAEAGPWDRVTTDRVRSIRRMLHRGIADANDSLSTQLLLRHAWKMRFRALNHTASVDEMRQMRAEVAKFLERVQDSENVLTTRNQETRLDSDIAKRAQTGDPADWLQDLQAKLISEAFRESGRRQRLLRQAERLFERLQSDLTDQLGSEPDQATWARIMPTLQSWWTYELLAVDDKPITLGKLFLGMFMVIGGVMSARVVSRAVGNRMLPRLGVHQGASMAAQTIAFYLLVLLFGLFTLEFLNIPITVLTFFGGAAAIAIGFGSQNILNNFISGLIILGEQPIRVGDLIEVDGLHGTVEHIGGRSTRVRTGSNHTIIIPNSKFVENNVKNLTLSTSEVRTVVRIGVAYGSDIEQVCQLLRRAVDENPLVLKRPEPIVLFTDFADSSLNFEVFFWLHMRSLMDVERSESLVRKNVDRLFREHQVAISFPQRDLHVDVTSPIELRLPAAPSIASSTRAA